MGTGFQSLADVTVVCLYTQRDSISGNFWLWDNYLTTTDAWGVQLPATTVRIVDDIDNAAALCPNCHIRYGNNQEKRKRIKEARDWWYKTVEKMYPDGSYITKDKLEDISSEVKSIGSSTAKELDSLKTMLKDMSEKAIENITPETVDHSAAGFVNASTAASSLKLADKVHTNMHCRNCGTRIGLLIGTDICPNCGERISGKI